MKRRNRILFFIFAFSACFDSFYAKKTDNDILVLKSGQARIESEIDEKAVSENYDFNTIAPIYDGIGDFDEFSKNKYRVMWILKEAYDDEKDGKPAGGGWFITGGNSSGDFDYVSKSWQRIAQTTYAIQKNEKDFSKLPKIESSLKGDSEYGRLLKSIIYINTNKMPGLTTSDNYDIQQKFYIWKPILKEQIQLYKPDIVIFGGTYEFYKYSFSDIFGEKSATPYEIEKFKNKACHGAFVGKNNRLYIDAYHPGYFMINQKDYFNGIIEIVEKWKSSKIK